MHTLGRVLHEADESARLANHPASVRPGRAASSFVVNWLNARNAGGTPSWFCAPDEVRSFCQSLSADDASIDIRDLPAEMTVRAGFSFADLAAYWVELKALGLFQSVIHQVRLRSPYGPPHLSEITPIYRRSIFIEGMASGATIGLSASERITNLLTMDETREADPALTPLVPIEGGLLAMNPTIRSADPQHDMLHLLRGTQSYGRIANRLGKVGEETAQKIVDRMSGNIQIAHRVKAVRRDGNSAGDLDVVLCDPTEKLLVVMEVRWHPSTASRNEGLDMSQAAIEKCGQVRRLRKEIQTGHATVRWAPDWPDVSGFRWRWFVLTRDVLLSGHRADGGDPPIGSWQMLRYLLPPQASLTELVDLMDEPRWPASWPRSWRRHRFGELHIEAETAHIPAL